MPIGFNESYGTKSAKKLYISCMNEGRLIFQDKKILTNNINFLSKIKLKINLCRH